MRTRSRAAAGTVRGHTRVAAGLLITLALGLIGLTDLTAASADAAPPPSSAAVAAAGWLAAQFDPTTSLIESAFVPGAADGVESAYAATSLRLVGGNDSVAIDAVDALESIVDTTVVDTTGKDLPGPLARFILAAVSVGKDPRSFGGTDLVARLEATLQTSGANAGRFGVQNALYDGAFRQGLALAALSMVTPRPASIGVDGGSIDELPAVAWLRGQQCSDGSWMPTRDDLAAACAFDPATFSGPDTNSTAMSVLGLHAVGADIAVDPLPWLTSIRNADGGWSFDGKAGSNTDPDSTGLVIAALRALGTPADTKTTNALLGFQIGGEAPADQLGAFYFPFGEPEPNLAATNDAVLGLSTSVWPASLTERPLEESPMTTTTTTATGATTTLGTTTTTAPAAATTTVATAATTPSSTTLAVPSASVNAEVAGESVTQTGTQSPSSLATTGTGTATELATSLALLLAGVGLLLGARRRAPGKIGR